MGAGVVKLAGLASLKYLNVILAGVLVATLCTLPVPEIIRSARRVAVLLAALAALDIGGGRRPPMFYRNALFVMGPLVPWLAASALAWNLSRSRFNLVTGLLGGCVAFTPLTPLVPRFQPRYLNPVTAMMALLGSVVLIDALGSRRRMAFAAQAILIVWGGVFVARMTSLRSGFDASPADRKAHRAIAGHVPAGGAVLSRSTQRNPPSRELRRLRRRPGRARTAPGALGFRRSGPGGESRVGRIGARRPGPGREGRRPTPTRDTHDRVRQVRRIGNDACRIERLSD